MERITIKEYADSRKVTYEAVCKQVRQYKRKELKGHLAYEGKLTLLDPAAVEFLDKHRMKRNIVLAPTDKEIQNDIKNLQSDLSKAMAEIDRLKSQIIAMQEERTGLLEDRAKYNLLLEDKSRWNDEIDAARHKLEQREEELLSAKTDIAKAAADYKILSNEKADLEKEIERFKPSIFGLYRKK